ncbi:hypothetical protein bcere0007_55420 [Bacillus mycoides]|nr:hypothetical protein bcere0007_55420 [Bacillus mycoides]KZD40221.1 hypothetical protein B4083_2054 [Bacillus cereus]
MISLFWISFFYRKIKFDMKDWNTFALYLFFHYNIQGK